jgi:Fic family protein
MDDLVTFSNDDALDPITQAAVVHAQFETIHPFADGNGRIGRALTSWVLAHRLGVAVPPPVSVFIAFERGDYFFGLTLFRDGPVDPWVWWMAGVLDRSAAAMTDLVRAVGESVKENESLLLDLRADSTARALLRLIPELPVVSAPVAASRLGVSAQAVRSALRVLAERGIVVPASIGTGRAGRPATWWRAPWLFDLMGPLGA